MTKKDYIKIADCINKAVKVGYESIYTNNENVIINKRDFINRLCKMFKKDNPNFNDKIFKKYTK